MTLTAGHTPETHSPWRVLGSDADTREIILTDDVSLVRIANGTPEVADWIVAQLNLFHPAEVQA